MDEELRRKKIEETRGMAEALVEDLAHIRNVLADQKKLRGDVRRLGGVARRLLVDNDLGRVAAPRIKGIKVRVPDNNGLYRLQKDRPGLKYSVSGGATIAGVQMRYITFTEGLMRHGPGAPDAEILIDLKLEQFLKQKVIFAKPHWFTRSDVVKYVAHLGHGVHSGKAATPEEEALSTIAASTNVGLQVLEAAPIAVQMPREVLLDGVAYEMLCGLAYLVASPDVQQLEELISSE